MKLRSTFPIQQLLFLATCSLLLLNREALAQSQAVVKTKTAAPQQGVVTGVTASGVAIQLSAGGSITIPAGSD